MCFVLKVSRSGFYSWLSRPASQRVEENKMILEIIKKIREEQPKKQVYGSLRMFAELKGHGISCGKNRVANIMHENGICSKIKRKFKQTTDSEHNNPHHNLPEKPHQANEPYHESFPYLL